VRATLPQGAVNFAYEARNTGEKRPGFVLSGSGEAANNGTRGRIFRGGRRTMNLYGTTGMPNANPREVAQELRDLDRTDVPLRVRAAIERAIVTLESVGEPLAATLPGGLSLAAREFLYPDVSSLMDGTPPASQCWCETCRPITLMDMRMVVCPTCGNKRCPRATDHRNACTGSNEPGQKGSSWERVRPLSDTAPPTVTASCQPRAAGADHGGPGADVTAPLA
jgi:hypothetical protein